MKVLHVFKSFYPDTHGGVERLIDELSISSGPLGVDSTVFSLSDQRVGEYKYREEYNLYFAKCSFSFASTNFSFSALRQFNRYAARADILHYHFPNPYFDVLHFLSRQSKSKPYVVTYHSDIVKQKLLSWVYAPLMKKFLKSANAIVATSENYVKSSLVLSSGFDNVSVIPIGLSESLMVRFSVKRLDYWEKKFPTKFFLYVGALRYYKGLDVAIRAVVESNMQLVIAGSGSEADKLKKLVFTLGLDDRVHFVGSVSEEDKYALLKCCYAFVFPSNIRSEAFGISLLEASACGKALISCEIGTGTSYVNLHNETGLVVRPSSVIELRLAMLKLINSPEITAQFGQNSKLRYEKYFRGEIQAKCYFELYKAML